MSDKTWKAFERTVARYFGTRRVPLSGSNSGHDTQADAFHDVLYVEAKRDRKFLGKTLLGLLHDTCAKAKKEGKVPVVCLKEHGGHGFWLVVHSKDLVDVAVMHDLSVVSGGE